MKRIRNATLLLALLLPLASLAHADDIRVDYDHNAVFERYHTFTWKKIQSDNPFYVSRIRDGVSHYLEQQGWQQVPSGGDVAVFVICNVKNYQSLQTFYDGFGGGWGWGGLGWGFWPGWGGPGFSTTTPVNQRVRNVVIDMYDSHTKQLLWRGITDVDLNGNPQRNLNRLYQDFAVMFHTFPPKPNAKG
jgi:hypothetical protein